MKKPFSGQENQPLGLYSKISKTSLRFLTEFQNSEYEVHQVGSKF
jgi:hypothetical protein